MADVLRCPICDTEAKPLDRIGDADGFDCVNDGRVRVAGSVFATTLRDSTRQTWEAALQRARARQPDAWAATITTDDF